MRKGKGALAALVLVGAVALSGCGIERSGVAATIGDQSLPISTVDARVQAYFDAYPAIADGPTKAQIAAATVQNFLRAIIVDDAAAKAHLTVTQTEINSFITKFGGMDKLDQAIASEGVPPDATLARVEVRSAILQGKLQDLAGPDADDFARAAALSDRTDAVAAQVRIVVNPRYGEWSQGAVNQENGSLSLTEAETTPTPTPSIEISPAG